LGLLAERPLPPARSAVPRRLVREAQRRRLQGPRVEPVAHPPRPRNRARRPLHPPRLPRRLRRRRPSRRTPHRNLLHHPRRRLPHHRQRGAKIIAPRTSAAASRLLWEGLYAPNVCPTHLVAPAHTTRTADPM